MTIFLRNCNFYNTFHDITLHKYNLMIWSNVNRLLSKTSRITVRKSCKIETLNFLGGALLFPLNLYSRLIKNFKNMKISS